MEQSIFSLCSMRMPVNNGYTIFSYWSVMATFNIHMLKTKPRLLKESGAMECVLPRTLELRIYRHGYLEETSRS
jgi:hypothetical protein